jgi:CheY-like chemotaxis protein
MPIGSGPQTAAAFLGLNFRGRRARVRRSRSLCGKQGALTGNNDRFSVNTMPTSGSPNSAAPVASRGTVLIADDDPEILTLLSIRLTKKGYKCLEAADGLQTLHMARSQRPDLVLLDVMMPGKNGWEVARELRNDPALASIGIVMLTAIGEKVNEMTSPLYGADDYVDKPFDFNDLEQKISRVIQTRRAQAQAQAAGGGAGGSTPTSGPRKSK